MSITIKQDSDFMVTADGRRIAEDPKNPKCRAKQLTPRYDLLKDLKEPLAVDIEFQEFKPEGAEKWAHRIGRFACVNTFGQTIWDPYLRYDYEKTTQVKMPPERFGVTWQDICISNGAIPIHEAREVLNKILAGRTIIGRGMRLDILSLAELKHHVDYVNTQNMYDRSLLSLAADKLKMSIQGEFHDPSEDARATMRLFLLRCPYNGRHGLEQKPFEYEAAAFPSLGSRAVVSKGAKGGAGGNGVQCTAVNNQVEEWKTAGGDLNSREDIGSNAVAEGGGIKRAKGKKAWAKFQL